KLIERTLIKNIKETPFRVEKIENTFQKFFFQSTSSDLSHNELEWLPHDVFDDMPRLKRLRLHGNPWNCACEKGLKDLLNSKPKISLGAEPVLCVTPDKFKDAKIQINKKCEINECLFENDCDDVATCIDNAFDYECNCTKEGFTGEGKGCIDIDECSGSNKFKVCAKVGAVCINTHGSYSCGCKKGYTGNGKQCTDINECVEHDCDQGECQNTQGSFRCDCFSGYAMNAEKVCVDIDECKVRNKTCKEIPHSHCVNLKKFHSADDGYRCQCENGYKRVGKSCVYKGDMKEWIKFLGMIIGGFFGILLLIIISAVSFRKWRN
ncbi:hypothetical protein pdam_00022842, partial [Pocillopora damicornis]